MANFSKYLSNPEILSLIGERLREWRIKDELTQNELMKNTGLSRGTIQNLEAGMNADLNTVVAVLRALDLVDNLNTFLPEPEPSLESLKEIRNTPSQRRRVRRKKVNG